MSKYDYFSRDYFAGRLSEVMGWLSCDQFSIDDYHREWYILTQLEAMLADIRADLLHRKAQIDSEDWRLFIETLPVLEEPYLDNQETVSYCGTDWRRDDEEEVYGHHATVYCPEDREGFLYVFKDGHYYDEAEWGEIELLSKEKMGISDRTKYRNTEDGVEAVSSGYVDFKAMYIAGKNKKPIKMSDFETPIIDRSDKCLKN